MELTDLLELFVCIGIVIVVFGWTMIALRAGAKDYLRRAAGGTDLALARIQTVRRAGWTGSGPQECELSLVVMPDDRKKYETTMRVPLPVNGDGIYRPGRVLVVAPATKLHPIAVVPIPPVEWARKAEARALASV